jgi:Leucine-rich repeat (LRR) protein
MRYLVCVALLASGLLAATGPSAWIEAAGGTVTRNSAGQISAVDLHASWVTDSDLIDLAAQPALTRLDLSMTRISDRGLLEMKPASNITELNLYYAEMVTDQGLAVLKGWKRLKRLNLRGTKVTDSTLQFLNGLTSLEALDIGFAQVTDSGLAQLTALSNLKELSVGGNKLTDAGLQALRQMPALTSLDLSGAQRTDSGLWSVSLTESGLDSISTLKNLRHLRLNGVVISPRGLEKLKGLGKLERLDLQACARINDDAVPVLESLPALKVVDVSAAAMSDKALGELRKAKPGLEVVASAFQPTKPAMPNGPAN